MKLLTKEITEQLIKAWDEHARLADEGNDLPLEEHVIYLKLFNPMGVGTWYLTEYCEADNVFFGFCHIHEGEWGYVSREELESFRGTAGLGIERDLHFRPQKVKDCEEIKQYGYIPLKED